MQSPARRARSGGGSRCLREGVGTHRCALAALCLPVRFPNSPEGFNLGARVENCLNSTGEIRGSEGNSLL